MSGLVVSPRRVEDSDMSEAIASQEPSMEEILASIRRIISEEGQEQSSGDALSAEVPSAMAAPAAAKPQPQKPQGTSQIAQAQTPPAAEEDDEDELVLTEVVTSSPNLDPTNVVPLKPEAKAETVVDEAEIDDEIELAFDESMAALEPAPEAGLPVEPELVDAKKKVVKSDANPQGSAAPKAEQKAAPAPNIEADEFAKMTEELPELVAPEVADAATASFAQLLQPSRRGAEASERPTGDGLLVETLVRQAVEPMLKAWLDSYLEPIVERIVRREVERLARKAELG